MASKVQDIISKCKKQLTPKVLLHIMQWVLVVAILLLGALVYFTVMQYMTMQSRTKWLGSINLYASQKTKVTSTSFRKQLDAQNTVDDVIALYGQTNAQLDITQKYYDQLQQPYHHFLQYFLLPPLNIWKDKYTGKIDDKLVGKKFLTENIYLDVNLISQWTDFFKNIGANSPKNDIKNIKVGTITEKDGGIFTMPIDVSFVAETKRSFLLLVDKVSMTSNRANLSLLNEFFYHLWGTLKEKQALLQQGSWQNTMTTDLQPMDASWVVWEDAATVGTDPGMMSGETQSVMPAISAVMTDAQLGEKIYEWAKSGSNTFITDEDINEAIRRTVGCDKSEGPVCYFRFREKYRSIPELAYTIWLQKSNKSSELRTFLSKMPPMINVKSFTFTKALGGWSTSSTDAIRWYAGNLSIEVYGTSMTAKDVGEIALYLWAQCTNGTPMSPEIALSQIDAVINQAASVTQISNEKSKELSDLRATLTRANAWFDSLPGFKKAVKLFEMYRMLSENRLCNTK